MKLSQPFNSLDEREKEALKLRKCLLLIRMAAKVIVDQLAEKVKVVLTRRGNRALGWHMA